MADPDPRSLVELLAELARDIPDLVHKEIGLAREQAKVSLALFITALRRLLFGSALAIGAVGVGLAAIVSALALFLDSRGVDPPLASTIAAITVTVASGLAAWLLLASATRSLNAARASLDGSVRTLSETLPASGGGHLDEQ